MIASNSSQHLELTFTANEDLLDSWLGQPCSEKMGEDGCWEVNRSSPAHASTLTYTAPSENLGHILLQLYPTNTATLAERTFSFSTFP